MTFDTVKEYRKFMQTKARGAGHMCGLEGFNGMYGDVCPLCEPQFLDRIAVDPDKMKLYAPLHHIGEYRSNIMDDNEGLGFDVDFEDEDFDFEDEDYEDYDDEAVYDIRDLLVNLETFLIDELDDECRGNVFLSESADGVAINILVGAPFQGVTDKEIKQINLIMVPTDRSLLGSEGVSIHDNEDVDLDIDDGGEESPRILMSQVPEEPTAKKHGWFDEVMRIFKNG